MSNKDFKVCKAISHPNIQSGWGCCSCRTFNGNQRTECKVCQHVRCDNTTTTSELDKDDLPSNWEIN